MEFVHYLTCSGHDNGGHTQRTTKSIAPKELPKDLQLRLLVKAARNIIEKKQLTAGVNCTSQSLYKLA